MNRMKKELRIASLVTAGVLLVSAVTGCGIGGKDAPSNESGADRAETSESMTDTSAGKSEGAAYPAEDFQTEEYAAVTEHGFSSSALSPLSAFSADVDTASYSNVRRMLRSGSAPEEIPAGAVRIEEMLNYFTYDDYEEPKEGNPFGITVNGTVCPWNETHGLLRIGLKTEDLDFSKAPKSNLVFLLDVSGSMDEPDKLPLLKQAFSMLAENLGENDRVSIVTYAGMDEIVMEGARGDERGEILEALNCLEASGSTNGSSGIQTAYAIAERYRITNGNNRVILATDGDLNVGITSESDLKDLITEKKNSGIYLSVIGFGTGNLKDNKLEALADNGNGNYAYIDSLTEAKKVLVDEMGSTFVTVAEDVKLQVEFNPARIKEYRLIGYENRMLNPEDFTDDTKDAGEVGAGHTVTALYEVIWADDETTDGPALKYQDSDISKGESLKEWATVKIRYKKPGSKNSQEQELSFGEECYTKDIAESGMLLEASAAEFGLLLRNSEWKGTASYEQLLSLWEDKSYGENAEIAELLELVRLAAGRSPSKDYQAGEAEELRLTAEPDVSTKEGGTFTLSNTTEQTYTYGQAYTLEKKINGGWKELEYKTGSAFTEEGILLRPGESHQLLPDWTLTYGKLQPGTYRMLKTLYGPEGEDHVIILEAEFEVEE